MLKVGIGVTRKCYSDEVVDGGSSGTCSCARSSRIWFLTSSLAVSATFLP